MPTVLPRGCADRPRADLREAADTASGPGRGRPHLVAVEHPPIPVVRAVSAVVFERRP